MSKISSSRFHWCKQRVKQTPNAKDIPFWSLVATGKILAEVPQGTPLSCHVVVKKCILMTWHDNVSWWCGILMCHDDVACWCGMMIWHGDVAWWHGMVMWHDDIACWYCMMMWHGDMTCWHGMMMWNDDMAWWSGMMTSMHAFVLEMSFRTFMHLLMRNCKMINIWSEWKNYSHITHLFYSLSCYEVNAWL